MTDAEESTPTATEKRIVEWLGSFEHIDPKHTPQRVLAIIADGITRGDHLLKDNT